MLPTFSSSPHHRPTPALQTRAAQSIFCMQGRGMESSDHVSLPATATLESMEDCCSGFALLSPSDELELFFHETKAPPDFYNVGDPSSRGPLVRSAPECVLGRNSGFPFDPAVSVEGLELLAGEVDLGVHENVPGDLALAEGVGFLGPQVFLAPADTKAENLFSEHKSLGPGEEEEEEEESPEIATVPVDIIRNKRPYRCMHPGCERTFRNPQTLKMHRKTHQKQASDRLIPRASTSRSGHNKKIPCRCPACGRTFVGLYELRRHFGRKHSEGEKMHDCKRCGKKFYIDVDLRDHEKICGARVGCKFGPKLAFECGISDHRRTHPERAEERSRRTRRLSPSHRPSD